MELYHIHLLGNHDKLYKEKSEFTVDKEKFKNRIYRRIYNMNSTVDVNRYAKMVEYINLLCKVNGIAEYKNRINLGELLELTLKKGAEEKDLINMLNDAKEMILAQGINMREMAMEEYRKQNCSNIPSRLHCLFACSEEGINFWINNIRDNEVDVFRIETYDEPFLSNEQLLPVESLNYGDKIEASYQYFHPREKDLDPYTNEYLVQGKVKILEKVFSTNLK